MADYAELIKVLRSCAAGDCIGCPYLNDTCPHNGQMMLQAAGAIEVLVEQNKAYLARIKHNRAFWTQRWISVEEQLPGPFDCVIISILTKNGYGDPITIETIAWYEHGKWVLMPGSSLCDGERITHWMPMPKPPEVKQL